MDPLIFAKIIRAQVGEIQKIRWEMGTCYLGVTQKQK